MNRTIILSVAAFFIFNCEEDALVNDKPTESTEPEPLTNGWVTYNTSSGSTVNAYYNHPSAGTKKPAVIYNHGKYVEENGYDGAVSAGYDIVEFADSLANSGYAGIAPLRATGSSYDDGLLAATINVLKDQSDIDDSKIFMYGFSRGGLLTHLYAVNDDSELKGVILVSPSPGKNVGSSSDEFAESFDDLNNISVPYLVLIGDEETNPTITSNVTQLVSQMSSLGKSLSYYLMTGDSDDATADHDWFYKVRTVYWSKIDSFLTANTFS